MPPPRSQIPRLPTLLPALPVLLPHLPILLLPALPAPQLPSLPVLLPHLPALVPDLPVLLRTRHVLLPIGRRHSRRPRISPQLPLHLPPYYAPRRLPLPRRLRWRGVLQVGLLCCGLCWLGVLRSVGVLRSGWLLRGR